MTQYRGPFRERRVVHYDIIRDGKRIGGFSGPPEMAQILSLDPGEELRETDLSLSCAARIMKLKHEAMAAVADDDQDTPELRAKIDDFVAKINAIISEDEDHS